MSDKKKGDWRAKGKPRKPRAGSEPRGAGWARKTTTPHERAKLWFRVKVGLWTLALTGMIAAFVVYMLVRPKWTPMLTVGVLGYGAEAPSTITPNALTQEDLHRLQETLGKPRIVNYSEIEYASWESGETCLKELRQAIKQADPGGPKRDTIIVYLSMHGLVNDQGQPCLLSPDVSPLESSRWLLLEDALRYLFPRESLDRLPRRKLLILDCNRMDANWRAGLLYNAFADGLEEVLARVDIPGLVVINSSSPAQIGWTSPEELGGSVFGYFVSEGLRGAADNKQEGGDGNKRVSLMELHTYLATNVDEWVQENRFDRQTPLLVPADAENFDLVFAKSNEPTSLPEPRDKKDGRWREVEKYWLKHPESTRPATLRFNPLVWAEFQQKLLRLERLILAGEAYRAQYDRTRKELDVLVAELSVEGFDGSLRRSRPEALSHRLTAYNFPLSRVRTGNTVSQPDKQVTRETWEKLLADPTGTSWPKVLEPVGDSEMVEIHFARILQAHLDPVFWKSNPQRVADALALNRQAEQAASPPDERTHYGIQSIVDTADKQRRTVEDRLFVGASEIPSAAESARSTYDEAIDLSAEIHEAYQWRDRARAHTPSLGQWLLDRLHHPSSTRLDDLDTLIRATHALDKELDTALTAGSSSAMLSTHLETVRTRLDTLEAAFRKECAYLWESAGDDRNTLMRIGVVLDVPLLTGRDRNRLREKYLQIARSEGGDRAVAPGESSRDVSRYLERIARFEVHPALAILDRSHLRALGALDEKTRSSIPKRSKKSKSDKSDKSNELAKSGEADETRRRTLLAQQGESVRRLLASVFDTADKLVSVTDERLTRQLKEPSEDSGSMAREGVGSADRLVRAAAGLIEFSEGPWEYPSDDPTHRLRYFDYHQVVLWQAHRSLDDFWGPDPSEPGSEPYFQISTEGYLASARRLWPKATVFAHQNIDLPTLLDFRRQAARDGIILEPSDVRIDEDQESTPLAVRVIIPEDMPRGESALFVRNLDRETIPLGSNPGESARTVRRLGANLVEGHEASPRGLIPKSGMPGSTGRLEVASLYRGHASTALFSWEKSDAGIPISFKPPDYQDPVVTVEGTVTKGYSVVFVLDYSGSMDREMEVVVDNIKKKTRRYLEARRVLVQILERLVKPGNPYHIGLLVYGHRVGWWHFKPDEDYEIVVWDPKNPKRMIPRPADDDRHPRDDVEEVLGLGPFSQFDLEDVRERLQKANPLGETPLYYAVVQAVEALRLGSRTPKSHVIVVTDGVDERSDVDDGDKVFSTDVSKALRSLGADPVRLDVVGFQLDREDFSRQYAKVADPVRRRQLIQEDITGFEELKRLSKESGGAFHTAKDPNDLLKALQKSLQLSQYQVLRSGDGRLVTPEPIELGQPAVIRQSEDVRVDYTIRLVARDNRAESEVELEGGEALELFVSEDRRRLTHKRFEQHLKQSRDGLRDPLDRSGRSQYFIGAHLPEWRGSAVRFRFSVQNHDPSRFSRRPAEAWIQIRPLIESKQAEVSDYVFYDLKYELDRPVPIISCHAPFWPENAKQAEARLWVKMKKTDPGERNIVPVDDRSRPDRFEMDGIPGVTFEIDPKRGVSGARYQVLVIERHSPGSRLDRVKVEMFPPPKQVLHRFNRETATVHHTFYFDDTVANRIGDYSVVFTSRDDIQRNAIALPKPLVVDIPRQGGPLDR